jgi:hypothetical protein
MVGFSYMTCAEFYCFAPPSPEIPAWEPAPWLWQTNITAADAADLQSAPEAVQVEELR